MDLNRAPAKELEPNTQDQSAASLAVVMDFLSNTAPLARVAAE
ncbi:hypothetical protein [Aquamicrobium zhengzhouense]|nr:hypothetical protein [Aquamicrobium zhengzhouense]